MSSVAGELQPSAGLHRETVAQLKTADGVLLHVAILDANPSGALVETRLRLPVLGHVFIRPLHAGAVQWRSARVISSARGQIAVEWLRPEVDAGRTRTFSQPLLAVGQVSLERLAT
jgi:hypothetical protein